MQDTLPAKWPTQKTGRPSPTHEVVERSRQIHRQRKQPWPCRECFPGGEA